MHRFWDLIWHLIPYNTCIIVNDAKFMYQIIIIIIWYYISNALLFCSKIILFLFSFKAREKWGYENLLLNLCINFMVNLSLLCHLLLLSINFVTVSFDCLLLLWLRFFHSIKSMSIFEVTTTESKWASGFGRLAYESADWKLLCDV